MLSRRDPTGPSRCKFGRESMAPHGTRCMGLVRLTLPAGAEYAGVAGIVVERVRQPITGIGENVIASGAFLGCADLDDEVAARHEMLAGPGDEPLENLVPRRAAVQGKARLVFADSAGQLLQLGLWDVGRIAENEIEADVRAGRLEKIAEHEIDPPGHAMPVGVAPGESQSV